MSRVIEANIDVHTRMADTYDTSEPHFRPENKAKVRRVLEGLRKRAPGGKLLDIGCGTGFVINLAEDLFDEIHGIDVTQAMLDRIQHKSHVHLHRGAAEHLPFPDASFDVVSAYAFLHHTEDYWAILKEAGRVLRPGGLCYVDLEPNKLFWERVGTLPAGVFHPRVEKARASVTETDAQVERDFGIPQETFRQAEYSKAILGGIDPDEIRRRANELGFQKVTVRHEWFLGQAEVMHGKSFEIASEIDDYLRSAAPLTDHLFKYLQIVLEK